VTNSIWEAQLEASGQQKPTPQSTREQRLRFITAKYADRAFVRPLLAMTSSHLASADETLLASIKRNDAQAVAHALAMGGSPNVVDRSRGTHAVFLALVAADPPSPPTGSPYGSPALPPSDSPPRPSPAPPGSSGSSSSSGPPPRKQFPIAEMLLLNGADLPPLPAPVPLSRAGRDYIEGKLEARGGGRRPTNASTTAPPPSRGGAPPSRGGGGGPSGLPSPGISSATPPPTSAVPTTVTMVGGAPAATALSPGLARQGEGKLASPGLPPHHHNHHRNNSHHQHQTLNLAPLPPRPQTSVLDEGGVGVGGDTLTALPAISPGAERRKRLSSGTRLVKQQAPGSLGRD
jgi:hypothetical protein